MLDTPESNLIGWWIEAKLIWARIGHNQALLANLTAAAVPVIIHDVTA
jgi:hypothetical protein